MMLSAYKPYSALLSARLKDGLMTYSSLVRYLPSEAKGGLCHGRTFADRASLKECLRKVYPADRNDEGLDGVLTVLEQKGEFEMIPHLNEEQAVLFGWVPTEHPK